VLKIDEATSLHKLNHKCLFGEHIQVWVVHLELHNESDSGAVSQPPLVDDMLLKHLFEEVWV
jgi:hypothetical protein